MFSQRSPSVEVNLNNIQTFSHRSDQYAKHRPQYPEELFAYLSELCQSHDSAWDCATGNGQAAVSCAKYFAHIEATDISAEQIQNRLVHPKVRYSVFPAEHTPFADSSFDLITVATAVHWFDQEQFHREVQRVLKPKGILAVWTYGKFEIEPKIYDVILNELLTPIDPYWANGNRQVLNGYRDLALPFEEIRDLPAFVLKLEWTLGQLLAYMRTWSAVKRFSTELGVDPVETLERALKPIWGAPDTIKVVQMPLFVKVSRKPA
jgi:ubiquinone/menaquinone biosynthesis C-methylase UbiE